MNMRFRLVTRFCEDMCSRVDYVSPEFCEDMHSWADHVSLKLCDDVTYMVLVLTEYYWNSRIMIGYA